MDKRAVPVHPHSKKKKSCCVFLHIFMLISNLYFYVLAPKFELAERNRYTVTWEALQAMRGDPIVYALQLLRGREVEQVR